MNKKISFFDYPHIYNRFKNEFIAIFDDVCSRGSFILQRELDIFEKELANYTGINNVIGVGDGTNALVIGLLCSGIKPGDQVIISPHTYVATAAAIKLAGGVPVCCNIDHFGYLDCSEANKLINNGINN